MVVAWVQTAASWYLQINPLWNSAGFAAGWQDRKALPWPFSVWDYAAYFSLAPKKWLCPENTGERRAQEGGTEDQEDDVAEACSLAAKLGTPTRKLETKKEMEVG